MARSNKKVIIKNKIKKLTSTNQNDVKSTISNKKKEIKKLTSTNQNDVKSTISNKKKVIVSKLDRNSTHSGVNKTDLKDIKMNYNKYDINEKIGVLVVNYNNLEYTKNVLRCLNKQINKQFKVTLVDQASTESGTNEFLKTLIDHPYIEVYTNNKNEDLNRVWNWFHSHSDCKYLCYLNNDIELTNNFIDDTLKVFMNEEKVGIVIHVTNNLEFTKNKNDIDYKVLNPPQYQGWDFTIRKEVYRKIPNTLRIFGGDDITFSYNLDSGYGVAMTFSSPIIHFKERTRVKIPEINTILKQDGVNYHKEMAKGNLTHVPSTMLGSYCNKYPPNGIKLTQNKNVVYTALIGDYTNLEEGKKTEGWDHICFTDNMDLKSNFWRVVYVPNLGQEVRDNYLLARYFKTNFHEYLSSYENIIWKDARIKIHGNLNEYVAEKGDVDFLFIHHFESKSTNHELNSVLSGNLEKPEIIEKIRNKYKKEGFPDDNGLMASGVLCFKNQEKSIRFFNDWWNEIKSLSYRDQLSGNYVLHKNKDIKYKYISYYKAYFGDTKFFELTKRITKRMKY